MNEPTTAETPPADPRLKTLEGELGALTQQVEFLRAAESKKQTATACVRARGQRRRARARASERAREREAKERPRETAAARPLSRPRVSRAARGAHSIFAFVNEWQQRDPLAAERRDSAQKVGQAPRRTGGRPEKARGDLPQRGGSPAPNGPPPQ